MNLELRVVLNTKKNLEKDKSGQSGYKILSFNENHNHPNGTTVRNIYFLIYMRWKEYIKKLNSLTLYYLFMNDLFNFGLHCLYSAF